MKEIRYWTTHTDKSEENWNKTLQLDNREFKLVLDPVSPDYIIASEHIYVSQKTRKKFIRLNDGRRVTLFFSGEAIFPDMNVFDYAVSFDKNFCLDDRIGRPPVIDFFRSHIPEGTELDKPRSFSESVLHNKTKFCNFIYANPHAHPNRDLLFHKLSEYKRVDSLGAHLNNVPGMESRGNLNWRRLAVEMKRPYKFSIAAENACYNGYATEKIISSFIAGTVPIYWGDPSIDEEFNPKAFINAGRFEDFNAVMERVKEVDSDYRLWMEMVSAPILAEEQVEKLESDRAKYCAFTQNIFSQDLQYAKRAPAGFWSNNYHKYFSKTKIQSISQRFLAAFSRH